MARRILVAATGIAACALLGTAGWVLAPLPRSLIAPADSAGVRVEDRHAMLLRSTRAADGTRTRWVPLDEMDPDLLLAFIAVRMRALGARWTTARSGRGGAKQPSRRPDVRRVHDHDSVARCATRRAAVGREESQRSGRCDSSVTSQTADSRAYLTRCTRQAAVDVGRIELLTAAPRASE